MRYSIQFLKRAERDLAALPERDRIRIARRIEELSENPWAPGAVALKGAFPNHYRLRVGDYRVIYQVEKKVLVMVVVRIGHRREIYRRL